MCVDSSVDVFGLRPWSEGASRPLLDGVGLVVGSAGLALATVLVATSLVESMAYVCPFAYS